MKKAIVILVLVGLGIFALVYFSPVTPDSAPTLDTELQDENSDGQDASSLSPEEQVDEALKQLENSELPPMQAILKIRSVAESYPGNVKANYTLGVLGIQTAQYEKAIGRFETVLETESDNLNSLQLIAGAHLSMGDTAKAKDYLSKAAALATDSARIAEINSELNKININ